MHKIMTALHQDHVNLAKLLQLLKEQVDMLAAGEDADLLLMNDIADYIRRYADHVHHPKEDIIYRVFRAQTAEGESIAASLSDEHQELPSVTLDFQRLLDGLVNDSLILSRQDLQEKITAFIQAQTEHLNTEEAQLFPLINDTLQDADWESVEKEIEEHADPLFGSHILDRYRNLHKLMNRQRA